MAQAATARELMAVRVDARMRDDEAALRAMVHPDFVLEDPASLPFGGRYEGAEGYFRFWRALNEAITDLSFSVDGLFEAKETPELVVAMTVGGRSTATGKTFSTQILERWSFRDGKLVGLKPFYFDTAALAPAFAK